MSGAKDIFAARSFRSPSLVCSGLIFLCLGGRPEYAAENREPWLELPQIGLTIASNGTGVTSSLPNAVHDIALFIPGAGSHIPYGRIHTKVNTESADVAMKSASNATGLVLNLDLSAAGGFPFQSGRNSVELEYEDQFGRSKYFNFLVDFPSLPAARSLIPEPNTEHVDTRPGKLFAVVIGISKYDQAGQSISNLQFADKDALSFLEFLKSPAGGGLSGDSFELLINEQATTQHIRHALFTFLTMAQPQDTVVIYFAGHGAPDPHDPKNLYFVTADSRVDDMGGTAFPMWQIQDVFERVIKARRVITITDTCHSFGFSGNRAGDEKVSNLFNQYVQRYASTRERAVITASDISESSYEDLRWGNGHGVFTYFLLKGLNGEADANHDGVVTAGELFSYLKRVVPKATDGKQNPRSMEGLASALPISVLNNRSSGLNSPQPSR